MKNITNKKLNQLTIIAAGLPKQQRKNPDGSKMFQAATKRIMGKDLPDSYKKQTDYFPDKYYLLKYEEPVLINHKQNLIDVYQKHGDIAVEDYVKACHKFHDKNKKPINKTKKGFWQNLKSHLKKWLSN